jgi:hypothetical protein
MEIKNKSIWWVIVIIILVAALIFQYAQLIQTKKHLQCVHEAVGFSFAEIDNVSYDQRWAQCVERKGINAFFLWD